MQNTINPSLLLPTDCEAADQQLQLYSGTTAPQVQGAPGGHTHSLLTPPTLSPARWALQREVQTPNKAAGERYRQAGTVKYTAVLRQIHPHGKLLLTHTYCMWMYCILRFPTNRTRLKNLQCVTAAVTYTSHVEVFSLWKLRNLWFIELINGSADACMFICVCV